MAIGASLHAALRHTARIVTDVEGPQTYAALRIGLGALLIANVSTLWPHLGVRTHALKKPARDAGSKGLRRAL